MSDYSITKLRISQWLGIIMMVGVFAGAYYYWSARAGVKQNTASSQPQGVGRLDSGLAGYWAMDNGSGTSATDSSTNGNTGTLTNGPTWITGQIGTAVDFDGTDDKISIATSPSLELTTKETISAWIYLEAVPSSGNEATILYKNSSGDSNFLYRFSVYNNGSNTRLIFVPGGGGGFSSSNTALTTSRWYHVMVTFDRPEVKFYLDGVLDGSSTDAVGGGFASGSGTTHIGGGGSGMVFLNGRVDEVRVYNRALSADEAGQLYRLTAPTSVDTSLKGYWSFDGQDMTATTAYDRSGAGKNLTLNNSPTPAGGRVGQGLSFDGTNDYASATYTPSGPNTLSAWIYPRSFADNPGIVGQLSPNYNSYGWGLSLDTSGNVHAISGNDNITWYNNLVAPVPLNQWSYVTATFSNCCNVAATGYLYINGVQVASYTGTADTYPYNFAIGARDNTSGTVLNYFNGSIDEVRIYNRALTATEIKSLYDIAAPDKTNSSSSQAQGTGRLDSGLAGYWPLDNGSGTSATDLSTNGNTGTLTNGPTWTTGQIASAVDFDGTNDHIDVGSSSALNFTGPHTINAWIYPTGFGGDSKGRIVDRNVGSTGYLFFVNNSDITQGFSYGVNNSVVPSSTGVASPNNSITLNTWQMVTASFDGTNVVLYKNGVAVASGALDDPVSSVANFFIGGRPSANDRNFDGLIDEVRAYNRALSADEVGELYRVMTPTGVDTSLKGYWSFNGKDMSGTTTVYDRSGLGSNGTLTNSPTIINGIIGQGLSFDGTNDHVNLGASTPYQFANTTFTVTGWFKSSPSVNGGAFVAQGGIAGQGGWFVGLNGDTTGKLSAVLKNTDGGQTGRLSSKTGFNDNNWHQFAFIVTTNTSTYTSNSLVIYADGVLQPSTANSDSTSGGYDIDGSTALLGSRGSASDAFFNGGLDEVRIYNRALTAAEIQGQYDAVKPDKVNSSITQPQGTGRLDSGLAGYWPLDNGSGTSATDLSTNGNTGTLTNGPTWTTGQIGSAVSFDGTDDSVDLGDQSVLEIGSQYTISAWIYPTASGSYPAIFAKSAVFDEGTCKYALYFNGASRQLSFAKGGTLRLGSSALAVPLNQWSFVGVSENSNGLTLWVNGVSEIFGTTGIPSYSTETAKIGLFGGGSGLFPGRIDEIRVYNRTLSADEVSQLYRLGTPTSTDTSLKGYWSFNGKDVSGTTAYDRSGSGYTGTLAGSPAVINGKLGQGLLLDGVDDFVNLLTVPSALFTNTTSTMTGWFKTSSSAGQGILSQDHCSGGWFIRIESGTLSVSLRAGGSCGGGSASRSSSATNLANGAWHHFAVVMTTDTVTAGNNNVVIYIDGAINQGALSSGLVYGTAADNRVQIGTRYSGDQLFSGSIDEVRIYNRALSASEVLNLYNASR